MLGKIRRENVSRFVLMGAAEALEGGGSLIVYQSQSPSSLGVRRTSCKFFLTSSISKSASARYQEKCVH